MAIGDRSTQGNWAKVAINGYDLSADAMTINIQHKYAAISTPHMNTGVEQFAPGAYGPQLALNGYRRGPINQNGNTAHTLLAPRGVGSANDAELIITALLGVGGVPAAGDPAFLMDATLLKYDSPNQPSDVMKFNGSFSGRGKRGGLGNLIVDSSGVAGTITSAVFDRGALAASWPTKGAVAHLQVLTPGGTQATGTVTLGSNPADGDTVVINGQTYTFKNALSAVGHVKIGATAAATVLNLFAALVGSQSGSGSAYYAGTTPLASTIIPAYPNTSNAIVLTSAAYGTGGNAYTLAKTGAAVTVSGATFSGGTAGDTYTFTIGSSTTFGGAYTTFATFVSNGQSIAGERLDIATGVTINRYIKGFATPGAGGNPIAFNIAIVFFWS